MSSSDLSLRELRKEKISLWTHLSRCNKPCVIYGTGDGAAKIMTVLEKKGIKVSGIFASDDFVRGQSFCGYKVMTLSQIEENFSDPVILVAFATKLEEIMERVRSMEKKHEVYIPDVNVYGDVCRVFDEEYEKENEERIEKTFTLLSTDKSRRFFASLLDYKLSGKSEYLDMLDEYSDEPERLLSGEISPESLCDLGAYCGDTVSEYTRKFPSIKHVAAFEPEAKSFKKLCSFFEGEKAPSLETKPLLVNAAAWNENGELEFGGEKGRGSSAFSSNSSFPLHSVKVRTVRTARVDDELKGNGFIIPEGKEKLVIKFDVEGCEREALEGCRGTIEKYSPVMYLSCYHMNEDIFLPLYIEEIIKKGCEFYMRRARKCFPAWETEYVILP